jgi:seryl-tRNA synthetase
MLKVFQVGDKLAKSKSQVDRYLSLEDDVETMQQDLENCNRQIDALTKRGYMLQKEFDEEQVKATTILKQLDRSEAEKKRLWDDMTTDDVWELGRRDASNKRQKID